MKKSLIVRWTILSYILLALSLMLCVEQDVEETESVDAILNAADVGSMSTYWHVSLGSSSGTSDWSFFEDGTGRFRRQNYPATDGEDITWTKIGSDAILVDSDYDLLPFNNFREIDGSFSDGSFTCKLGTNETIRTFALMPGSF